MTCNICKYLVRNEEGELVCLRGFSPDMNNGVSIIPDEECTGGSTGHKS